MNYIKPEIKISYFENIYTAENGTQSVPSPASQTYDAYVPYTALFKKNSENIQDVVSYKN